MKTTQHPPTPMLRRRPYAIYLRYSTKNYSAEFECSACHRTVWQSLNYLGQKHLECDGARAHKVSGTYKRLDYERDIAIAKAEAA